MDPNLNNMTVDANDILGALSPLPQESEVSNFSVAAQYHADMSHNPARLGVKSRPVAVADSVPSSPSVPRRRSPISSRPRATVAASGTSGGAGEVAIRFPAPVFEHDCPRCGYQAAPALSAPVSPNDGDGNGSGNGSRADAYGYGFADPDAIAEASDEVQSPLDGGSASKADNNANCAAPVSAADEAADVAAAAAAAAAAAGPETEGAVVTGAVSLLLNSESLSLNENKNNNAGNHAKAAAAMASAEALLPPAAAASPCVAVSGAVSVSASSPPSVAPAPAPAPVAAAAAPAPAPTAATAGAAAPESAADAATQCPPCASLGAAGSPTTPVTPVPMVYEVEAELAQRLPPVTKNPVYTIVLTGGPCGGKTSSLDKLTARLKQAGFAVYSCPEVATTLISNGCSYPGLGGDRDQLIAFEVALLRLQMMTEATFLHIAASVGQPSVVLLDRGLGDPRAYLPDALWDEILPLVGLSHAAIHGRYDLVLHLETAAKRAEQHYTRGNNAARTETVEEACKMDDRVWDAWRGHTRHITFDNSTDFEGKLGRVIAAVEAFVAAKGGLDKAGVEAAVAAAAAQKQ